MRTLFFILLCLFAVSSFGQGAAYHSRFFSADSFKTEYFRYELRNGWRFHAGGDSTLASPACIDSAWPATFTDFRNNAGPDTFIGAGWFRYHFSTDSSLNDVQLAIGITHYGASELYCDGKKIHEFGVINGKDGSEYMDPQKLPVPLPSLAAGRHVLAIHYANYYNSQKDILFKNHFRGFSVELGTASSFIMAYKQQTSLICTVYMLLFGIFISLAVSHMFLYLFNRSLKPNFYFSVFCLSLSTGFLITYLNRETFDPAIEQGDRLAACIAIAVACFSLSGFTNSLFSRNNTRFRVIIGLSVIAPFAWILHQNIGLTIFVVLAVAVLLENIILTIRAMYQRIRGARILGFGILFFTLFILAQVLLSLNGIPFTENTLLGEISLITGLISILSIPISLSLYLAWNFAHINRSLEDKLRQVEVLSQRTIAQEQEKKKILETQNETLEREVASRTAEVVAQKDEIEKQHDELKVEKKKSDDLLLNILPEEVAEELKEHGSSEARLFNNVTVMFTDFVDFTKAGEAMSAKELVSELHICFKAFDEIIAKYNIEKIKTIGDAYLAVSGLPVPDEEHAINILKAANEIVAFMKERRGTLNEKTFEIRIGVHSGNVVAGIVGVKKFAYDIWGDTVNTAARMEQHSQPGRINISQATYELVSGQFGCEARGAIEAKNKGAMTMYFVNEAGA